MKCPVCDVTLVISSREGVEIDHCPQCRGVWLDRGELDKIIERAAPVVAAGSPTREPDWDDRPRREDAYRPDDRYRDDDRSRYRDDDDDRRRPGRKRRGSFLEDLFDFD
jgi:Zn-finger nucleic acid-binding protein